MRALFLLLALLSAWSPGERAHHQAANLVAASGDQISESGTPGEQAFVRVGSGLAVLLWEDGTGPRGRAPANRTLHPLPQPGFSGAEALPSGHPGHVDHTADLALLRAGRSSFHTATPPPFRSV